MTRTKNAALVDIRTRELAGAELFDICALQAAALDDVRLAFPARLGHTHSVGIDIFAGAVAKTCLVDRRDVLGAILQHIRSEEHTSELQSLMRISYAVFCLKKKKHTPLTTYSN